MAVRFAKAFAVVQKVLGHASAAMTLDIYADLEAVANALRQARSQTNVGKVLGTGWAHRPIRPAGYVC